MDNNGGDNFPLTNSAIRLFLVVVVVVIVVGLRLAESMQIGSLAFALRNFRCSEVALVLVMTRRRGRSCLVGGEKREKFWIQRANKWTNGKQKARVLRVKVTIDFSLFPSFTLPA